jgi:NCS2 family nucleobase:cation symporter-2
MNQKPSNIIYGVDDLPPFSTLFFLAFQHAVLALVFIVYPLMLVAEVHGTQHEAEGIVTAGFLAVAITSLSVALIRQYANKVVIDKQKEKERIYLRFEQ